MLLCRDQIRAWSVGWYGGGIAKAGEVSDLTKSGRKRPVVFLVARGHGGPAVVLARRSELTRKGVAVLVNMCKYKE